MVLWHDFVVELGRGRPESPVLNHPEGIVLVSSPDVKGEGPGVGIVVSVGHGEPQQDGVQAFVFLDVDGVVVLGESRPVVVGVRDVHVDQNRKIKAIS